MSELFANNATIIVFLHVLSAVVWVGGMIAIRFGVHPAMAHIEDESIRLARTLELLKNFFVLVIPMIVLLIITAVIMSIGLNFKAVGGMMYGLVHAKEAIWLIMTLNFIIIYIRRNKAERAFIAGDSVLAKSQLAMISKYMIPVNILLGLAAIFTGVILRGF